MTLADALDLVVARTGVERYRYLCTEHPNPRVRAEYSGLVMRLATAPPDPTTPTAAESLKNAAAVRRCQYRSIESSGGCGCARCGLRGAAKVSLLECIECVRRYD